MKIHFLGLILTCLPAIALLGADNQAPDKPNILFIAVDDLRPELGCYGETNILSPHIDALAKSGMLFKRAYVSQALCCPSRTAVMTGVRPDTSKVYDLTTHFRKTMPNVVTLGQSFQNNGYFVEGIGKIFHGKLDDPPTWSTPWKQVSAPMYADETHKSAGSGEKKGEESGGGKVEECLPVPDNTYTDGQRADAAINSLQSLSGKQPFFLAVGFARPHLPFVAPKKYWDLYDEAKIELAPNPFPAKNSPSYALMAPGEVRGYAGMPQEGIYPEALQRRLKHGYFACVSYVDAQIGRVIDELKKNGLDKNTIIVLWGDHGWKLGEHGAWAKHSNVENDVWAPLLISVPGMTNAGSTTDALIEFVDIYPSLCELAKIPLPPHLEGTSFAPLLADPTRAWKTAAFSQYPRNPNKMGYSMRTDRYRLTVWVDTSKANEILATELYDEKNDPQENVNIAGNPENSAVLKGLMTQWTLGWKGAKPR